MPPRSKKTPIDQWPSFHRQTFIREAQPIHDLYEQALKAAK